MQKYAQRTLGITWSVVSKRVTGWGGVDWTGLAQDRELGRALVNAVMNHLFP
jgi:hypothetical protein